MRRLQLPDGACSIDMHVHTAYSKDSLLSLAELTRAVQQRGLTAIAVTDHNRIEGALRLRDSAPFPVIVGEEILTRDGEVIGLHIERAVPRGLSPEEAVAAIREQGGLVYLPHPTDGLRRSVMCASGIACIIDEVDIVEVVNARVFRPADNASARALADLHHKAHGAGSDSHTAAEIGTAYVELPACDWSDPVAFLAAIHQGRACGVVSSRLVHVASTVAKVAKRLGIGVQPSTTT
ncbi:MAG: PHP domain-containing protein [Anaerolineae bacterium]